MWTFCADLTLLFFPLLCIIPHKSGTGGPYIISVEGKICIEHRPVFEYTSTGIVQMIPHAPANTSFPRGGAFVGVPYVYQEIMTSSRAAALPGDRSPLMNPKYQMVAEALRGDILDGKYIDVMQ